MHMINQVKIFEGSSQTKQVTLPWYHWYGISFLFCR